MKQFILFALLLCIALPGCRNAQEAPSDISTGNSESDTVPFVSADAFTGNEDEAVPNTIYPLPDSTMDNIENSVIAISLEENDAYVDDTGIMRMKVKVYSYDLFDMVDIAGLRPGDVIVTHTGETEVSSVERNTHGTVLINGGLDTGGFELFSDDSGVYYEVGFSDAKNWYEVGEVTLRVSTDLRFRDNADPEKGEQIYYAGSFLVGEVTDYHFTPHNTTIRTENGQIVSMERVYTP